MMFTKSTVTRGLSGLTLSAVLLLLGAERVLGAGIRTVLVSPVPGDAIASGTNLLSALAVITDANSTNRYLVKVEPGIFDLGTTALVMKQYVDIEGSVGTRIQGKGRADFFGGVIQGASNCGLRDLTVIANGNNTSEAAVAIYLSQVDTKVARVRAVAQNALSGADAILVKAGAPKLEDVEAVALNSPFSTGIALELGTSASVQDSVISASNSTNTSRGMLIHGQQFGAIPLLSRLRITASGSQRSYGIEARFSVGGYEPDPFTASDLTISASEGSVENVGVRLFDYHSTIIFHSSRIAAEGTAAVGVHAASYNDEVSLHQCMIKGSQATVRSLSTLGTIPPHMMVGGSLLDGGPVTGLVSCVAVYDENQSFFPTSCP